MTEPNFRQVAGAWLPAIAWAAVIWHLGGDSFGSAQSDGMLRPLLERLFPWIGPEDLTFVLWLIRRTAHPGVYGVLALLTWRAFARSFPAFSAGRQTAMSLALVSAFAAADETRQAGSTVREGHASDVALDIAGGAAVLGARAAWAARRRQGKEQA